ncbi:MAG: cyclase [Elusimicrobia bacterium RIFCSPLOWO2_01_FULL_54_10]|nr:MAG: cyclase [Elusimicrobia bacterium RIFCSPLOWO2_01_FULL_54_10]
MRNRIIPFLFFILAAAPCAGAEPSLWDIYKTLSGKKFVDMTHPFRPGIPHWKGFPNQQVKQLYSYGRDGFRAERYSFTGQWGTHVDPPAHFHQGLRTVDEIPPREMIAPLVVIDISSRTTENPDTALDMKDVLRWEAKYGKIPAGAFVVKRDDWGKRWPDPLLMENPDVKGRARYPGWSVDALKFLVQDRNIIAIGHETLNTDCGLDVTDDRYPAQTYILGENRYQIGLIANADEVPEFGALAVITFPKPEKGSGFPARVFAILP